MICCTYIEVTACFQLRQTDPALIRIDSFKELLAGIALMCLFFISGGGSERP